MAARIFVEGAADKRFVEQYIQHLAIQAVEIVPLGGGNLNHFETKRFEFERAVSDDVKSLVIVDADANDTDRINDLIDFITNYGINRNQLFLIPNDVGADGELEDLLFGILPEQNRPILDCLDTASNCVEQLGFAGMDKKDRVYQYVTAQLSKSERAKRGEVAGEAKRDYLNSTIWNLDSPSLDPLKEFLQKHLS